MRSAFIFHSSSREALANRVTERLHKLGWSSRKISNAKDIAARLQEKRPNLLVLCAERVEHVIPTLRKLSQATLLADLARLVVFEEEAQAPDTVPQEALPANCEAIPADCTDAQLATALDRLDNRPRVAELLADTPAADPREGAAPLDPDRFESDELDCDEDLEESSTPAQKPPPLRVPPLPAPEEVPLSSAPHETDSAASAPPGHPATAPAPETGAAPAQPSVSPPPGAAEEKTSQTKRRQRRTSTPPLTLPAMTNAEYIRFLSRALLAWEGDLAEVRAHRDKAREAFLRLRDKAVGVDTERKEALERLREFEQELEQLRKDLPSPDECRATADSAHSAEAPQEGVGSEARCETCEKVADLASQLKDIQNEADRAWSEGDLLTVRLGELEDSLVDLREAREEAQEAKSRMERDIAATEELRQRAAADAAAKAEELEALRSRLAEIESLNQSLSQQIATADESIGALTHQIEERNKEFSQERSRFAAKDEALAQARNEIDALRAEVEQLHTERQSFEAEHTALRQQIREISTNLSTVQTTAERAETKIARLRAALEVARAETAREIETREQVKAELNALRERLQQTEAALGDADWTEVPGETVEVELDALDSAQSEPLIVVESELPPPVPNLSVGADLFEALRLATATWRPEATPLLEDGAETPDTTTAPTLEADREEAERLRREVARLELRCQSLQADNDRLSAELTETQAATPPPLPSQHTVPKPPEAWAADAHRAVQAALATGERRLKELPQQKEIAQRQRQTLQNLLGRIGSQVATVVRSAGKETLHGAGVQPETLFSDMRSLAEELAAVFVSQATGLDYERRVLKRLRVLLEDIRN
jgi:predicted  nucleic acid-binding Zn-ribbon protein